MDPADSDALRQTLSTQLSHLSVTQHPSIPPAALPPVAIATGPPPNRQPHIVDPEPYSREPLKLQEREIAVPSVQHHLRRCRKVWKNARSVLIRSAENNRCLAD
ncbi:hypothetical protein JOB18_015625 [Solea senegalensis]|uniref:Uncharacterized protein n=1 Tax=Solea senegalensis TaxID=28829 RepID=A0AAV6PDX9_SOLSE|nr:hypothetical protein JOB18_015625 [Solea senegalensis]